MPYVNMDGTRLFYAEHDLDAACNLVCIHGAGCDHTIWPTGLGQLPMANCWLPDLPGHGRSGGAARDSIAAYADTVEDFVETLDLTRVTLAGHSMGGAVAMTLARRQPDWLEGLVLIGCGSQLPISPELMELLKQDPAAGIERMLAAAFAPGASPDTVAYFRRQALAVEPAVWLTDFHACNAFDMSDSLGDIPQRTLILSGDTDQLTPLRRAQHMEDNLADARLAVIAPAGHMLPLEQPTDTARLIGDFLRNGDH